MDVFDNQDLKRNYKKIRDFINGLPLSDDAEVPLTYLIQALYPNAYENFNENYKKQYTLGYIQGKEDAEANSAN